MDLLIPTSQRQGLLIQHEGLGQGREKKIEPLLTLLHGMSSIACLRAERKANQGRVSY